MTIFLTIWIICRIEILAAASIVAGNHYERLNKINEMIVLKIIRNAFKQMSIICLCENNWENSFWIRWKFGAIYGKSQEPYYSSCVYS